MSAVVAFMNRLTGADVKKASDENSEAYEELMRKLEMKGYHEAFDEIAALQRMSKSR